MRKLPDDKIRHVQRLGGRGLPQKEIATIVGISVGMVNKILRAQTAPAAPSPDPPPPPASSPDAADVPEVIPDGVAVDVVDKWIPKVEKAVEAAEAAKDYASMSSLMAKLVALLEHKRKATPEAKQDPNEHPDMIAAKARARKEFHRLIDHSLITKVRFA
jgi:transcriptional regulator with XRE-family HTH domain